MKLHPDQFTKWRLYEFARLFARRQLGKTHTGRAQRDGSLTDSELDERRKRIPIYCLRADRGVDLFTGEAEKEDVV